MSKEGAMGGKRGKPHSVRLEPDLLQWVKERANAGDRSLNAEINRVLRIAMVADAQDKLNLPHSDAVDTILECGISELKSSTFEKTGEVFSGKLYTLVEVYQQAAALSQIDGCGVHVELTLGQPDPFNSDVFPCCSGCIHFTEHDYTLQEVDEGGMEFGTCMRYPQRVRVEWAGRCGEYLGGAIFSDSLIEKIGK